MDEVLLKLQEKYEYLDFDDTTVLNCFKKACINFNESESNFQLDIEYHFLHELVLEMQKGNNDIYDAVLLGLNNILNFFLIKRKDLASKVDKKDYQKYYDMAFKNAVNSYYKKMSFTSELMKNIIITFKIGLNNPINDKSFYSEFDCSKELIDHILYVYDESSISLLIRQYGIHLDGVCTASNLDNLELIKLEEIKEDIKNRIEYFNQKKDSSNKKKDVKVLIQTMSSEEIKSKVKVR